MRFSNPFEAYTWAVQVLESWRHGKAFDPNPDYFGRDTRDWTNILEALDIESIAKRACQNPCPCYDPRCFIEFMMPNPTAAPPPRSDMHTQRIYECMKLFEELLIKSNIIR